MTTPPKKQSQSHAAQRDAIYIQEHHLTLVPIRPGTFRQGTGDGYAAEIPVRIVDLTQPFMISERPITQRQYAELMLTNPSYFPGTENPVETVRWYDAIEYCRRLTIIQRTSGNIASNAYFRLPLEAEWEYCCRTSPESTLAWTGQPPKEEAIPEFPVFSFGDDPAQLGEYAWYADNSEQTTHPVAEKKIGNWHLYDMHGNIAEWCQDWYSDYTAERVADPQGPPNGGRKIRRGGGWSSVASRCRGTDRIGVSPDCQCALIGFRIVLADTGAPPYPIDHMMW